MDWCVSVCVLYYLQVDLGRGSWLGVGVGGGGGGWSGGEDSFFLVGMGDGGGRGGECGVRSGYARVTLHVGHVGHTRNPRATHM